MGTMVSPGSILPRPLASVVVAVDFTEGSDVALAEAVRLTRGTGAALHIVHAADADRWMFTASAIDREDKVLEESRERLRRYVREKAREILDPHERVQVFLHLRQGDPVEAVERLCADVDADLVIVGTYEHTGLGRVFHTPLGDRLVREARCPVLVARPKRYDAADADSYRTSVEPPCSACLQIRRDSGMNRWWCDRHEAEARTRHQVAYSEEMPFERSDEALPTGY